MSHVLHALLHSLECEILVTALTPLKKLEPLNMFVTTVHATQKKF